MSTMRTPEASRCSVSQSVVTRDSKCSIALLLEEVVFAGVGLGELAGLLLVVLAEATLYDLVPEVVFEDLDPTSRPAPELPHEVVAIQRALEPLYGVLGPDLIHPFLEAAPGLLAMRLRLGALPVMSALASFRSMSTSTSVRSPRARYASRIKRLTAESLHGSRLTAYPYGRMWLATRWATASISSFG